MKVSQAENPVSQLHEDVAMICLHLSSRHQLELLRVICSSSPRHCACK